MFRAQVLRRGFSLWNSVPTSQIVRSASRDGYETIHIQRIRLRKPFLSRSRLLGVAIISASIYGLSKGLGENNKEEEGKEKVKRPLREIDQKGDDGGNDHALLFFPTGLSRAKPRTYYKGSDPEWQEFRRLAPDRKRRKRMRRELTEIVRRGVMDDPWYKKRLGKIYPDLDLGAAWLELRFPDGPPIEFERPGIEVTEDLEFRRTTRPVNEMHHLRLNHVLFPTSVANSLYADGKMRIIRTWKQFRSYAGWDDQSKKTGNSLVQSPTSDSSSKSKSPTSKTSSTSSPNSAPSATSIGQQPETQAPPSSSQSQKDSTTQALGKNSSLDRYLPSLPPPTTLTPNLAFFWQNLRREMRKQPLPQIPRGSVIVSGLISVHGDRASATLDVAAAYDPKIGKYVTLVVKLRSVKDHQQPPKGGR